MRVAIFTDIYTSSGTGGIVSSIKAQKTELEKMGHEVVIFCPGFRNTEKNVVLVPSFRWLKINGAVIAKSPAKIEEFILQKYPEFDFDVVHIHYEAGCSIAGINLAKKFEIPVVQTMHGREDMAIAQNVPKILSYPVAVILNGLHGKYLAHNVKVKKDNFQAPTRTRAKMWSLVVNHANQADVVVVPGDHFGKKLQHYGLNRPVTLVPNGLPEIFTGPEFSVRKYEDGDVLKMIWNSRVSHEKRFMPFLRALKELRRPYMLYVYGDGNELKQAKKFAKRYKLKVKFFGAKPREQIIERMKDCHLGVCTSYNFDTQGMVLIEAEATGLPAFLCDPALIEVLPRDSYILAGGIDATSLAMALNNFKANEIERMSKVMLKHRAEVAEKIQAEKILKAYDLAIKEHKKSGQEKAAIK